MSNQAQSQNDKKYDLAERTASFGRDVILFTKTLPENSINKPLISQFIRNSTSIGANYMEADCAESRRDFLHKIGICKKEAKEATHWAHMLSVANPDMTVECRKLRQEAHELTLIFSAITKKK